MHPVQRPAGSPVWLCSPDPRTSPRPASQAHFPSSSSLPGSPRNNEAWAAPAASFAYRRGLANGLRRGFGRQCCHQLVRVCASVTAAVAVAVAVGGWPGEPSRAGTGPGARFPSVSRPRGPAEPRDHPAPAGRRRDVGGGAEEAVPQSQPGREAQRREGGGLGSCGRFEAPGPLGLWRP